jgi:hypothetical protein
VNEATDDSGVEGRELEKLGDQPPELDGLTDIEAAGRPCQEPGTESCCQPSRSINIENSTEYELEGVLGSKAGMWW